MSKICKCTESYVSFNFTKVTRNGRDCAQCLHCSVVMSNASLRPFKLKNYRDKNIPKERMMTSMFCLPKEYNLEAPLPHLGFAVEEKPTFHCSYEVGYRIAKCKKPHTIAEKLIKPFSKK